MLLISHDQTKCTAVTAHGLGTFPLKVSHHLISRWGTDGCYGPSSSGLLHYKQSPLELHSCSLSLRSQLLLHYMAPGTHAAHPSAPAAEAHVQEVIPFFGPPHSPTSNAHHHYTPLVVMTWSLAAFWKCKRKSVSECKTLRFQCVVLTNLLSSVHSMYIQASWFYTVCCFLLWKCKQWWQMLAKELKKWKKLLHCGGSRDSALRR